jgi:hypothetical protein
MLQSGLALLGGDPGNAILLNGEMQTVNLEIGVPGFQPQVPTSTSEFRLRAARSMRSFKEFWRPSGAQLDRVRLRRKCAEGRSGVPRRGGSPGAPFASRSVLRGAPLCFLISFAEIPCFAPRERWGARLIMLGNCPES